MKTLVHHFFIYCSLILALQLNHSAHADLVEEMNYCEQRALNFTGVDQDIMDEACYDVIQRSAGPYASIVSPDGTIQLFASRSVIYQNNSAPEVGKKINAGRGANAYAKDIVSLALSRGYPEVYAYDSTLVTLFTYKVDFFGDCSPIRVAPLSDLQGSAGSEYLPLTEEIGLSKPYQKEIVFVSRKANSEGLLLENEVKVSSRISGSGTHLEKPVALAWDSKREELLVLDLSSSYPVIRSYIGSSRGDVPPNRELHLFSALKTPATLRYDAVNDQILIKNEDGTEDTVSGEF